MRYHLYKYLIEFFRRFNFTVVSSLGDNGEHKQDFSQCVSNIYLAIIWYTCVYWKMCYRGIRRRESISSNGLIIYPLLFQFQIKMGLVYSGVCENCRDAKERLFQHCGYCWLQKYILRRDNFQCIITTPKMYQVVI